MAKIALDFDVPKISLERQLEQLAIESNVLANVIDTFRNIVPDLKTKIFEIKDRLTSSTTASDKDVKHCEELFRHLSPKIKYANYVNYSKTLVAVPESFKGNLLQYILLLNKHAPEVYSEANKLLGEYNFVLSTFISNKETKISIKDNTDIFHKAKTTRERISVEISAFFPTNNPQSRNYLGHVIERFYDLEKILEETKKLNNTHSKQNIKNIAELVNNSCDSLDIIIRNLQTDGVGNVSGNSAKNISEGAYEVAKYVEFVSAFRYNTEQAIVAVEKLFETVDRVIK